MVKEKIRAKSEYIAKGFYGFLKIVLGSISGDNYRRLTKENAVLREELEKYPLSPGEVLQMVSSLDSLYHENSAIWTALDGVRARATGLEGQLLKATEQNAQLTRRVDSLQGQIGYACQRRSQAELGAIISHARNLVDNSHIPAAVIDLMGPVHANPQMIKIFGGDVSGKTYHSLFENSDELMRRAEALKDKPRPFSMTLKFKRTGRIFEEIYVVIPCVYNKSGKTTIQEGADYTLKPALACVVIQKADLQKRKSVLSTLVEGARRLWGEEPSGESQKQET